MGSMAATFETVVQPNKPLCLTQLPSLPWCFIKTICIKNIDFILCPKEFSKSYNQKGLIFKIYKEFKQLNNKKTIDITNIKNELRNWTVFQRRQTNGNRYLKGCSTSLMNREMQIKTTMLPHAH